MKAVDDEVIALVKAQHKKAYKILEDNIMKLHEIVKYLYEKETISGEEFMKILESSENAIEEQAKAAEAEQTVDGQPSEVGQPAEDGQPAAQQTTEGEHTTTEQTATEDGRANT